jgi:hypothetical protein
MNPQALLLDAHQRFDTTGGTASLDDYLEGCEVLNIDVGGQTVGAVALRLVEHKAKRVAWIMLAAARHATADLTATVMPALEFQARTLHRADQLAVTTRRRGLVRKLQRQGFEVSGITLRKNLA